MLCTAMSGEQINITITKARPERLQSPLTVLVLGVSVQSGIRLGLP